jgi:RNA polymerase sigma-70 factor (sigma-E family)
MRPCRAVLRTSEPVTPSVRGGIPGRRACELDSRRLKPRRASVRLSKVEPETELADFCRQEWPRLAGSLALFTGDRDLAEELAQEALIRVCEHWGQVREASSPSAWAHRVGFNLAKSHFRRWAAARRVQRLDIPVEAVSEPDTASRVALRQALAELSEVQRETLVLRYFVDLSVLEVAALMNCPVNTVKTHTRRALEALRRHGLGDDEATDMTFVPSEGTG